ncbi:pentatricopeptide repeat-containing protein At3g16010 [Selaginella moellendorffii]|uniref:pentatricopeptide repeat-containing protein At3g16010 n=1 Tax=Selaginella moellendorffii TaxID=88036 RepID=UPI000D1C512E|nr:pentatricopeptide repeat-containing protein At3g16010 [Selaginella moellendorffii]|eukprot:XP_024524478.1 pentatricopeptide repeat-containing protein At3g16010 [Selaginella moellendorffii]
MRLLRYRLLRKYHVLSSSRASQAVGCGHFLNRPCSSAPGDTAPNDKADFFDCEDRINAALDEKYGLDQQGVFERIRLSSGSMALGDGKTFGDEGRVCSWDGEDNILAAIEERYNRKEEPEGKQKFEFLSVLQNQHSEDSDGEEEKEEEKDGFDSELSDDDSSALVEYVRKDRVGATDFWKPSKCFLDWSKLRRTIVEECVEAVEKRTAATDLKVVLERWDGMVGNALVAIVLRRLKDSDSAFAFFKFAGQQYNFTHDAITYEALIKFLVRVAKDYRRGLLIYKYVERARIQPNEGMMELLVEAAIEGGEIDQALQFAEAAWKTLGRLTPEVCRRVIVGLFKAGRMEEAVEFLETQMEFYGCEKDLTHYNAVLCGLSKAGRMEETVELFEKMEARNGISYVIMVEGFAQQDDLDECLKFASRMSVEGYPWTAATYASVIGLYGKRGRVDEAFRSYKRMVAQRCRTDARVFNATLGALSTSLDEPVRLEQCHDVAEKMVWNGHTPDALELFRLVAKLWDSGKKQQVTDLFGQMERSSKDLDESQCFRFVARLCEDHRVVIAMKFYRVMIEKKMMLDGKTFGILFSELCRTGKADEAYMLFAKLDEKNAVRYDGETHRLVFDELCRAKRAFQAFRIYASMVKQSLPTDDTMLASLLSGLLEEGSHHKLALAVYNAMLRRGFTPGEESSRLLVQMLSKAGDLESAERVAADSIEKSFFVPA